MAVVRLFLSAVSPGDLDELVRLFREDVVPAFEAHPSCLGIELVRAAEAGAGGLIEGGALIRWTSADDMNEALESPAIQRSQVRIRELLQRQPLSKVYEVVA